MQIQPLLTPSPTALPQAVEPAATPGAPAGGFAQLMANTRGERETVRPRDGSTDEESPDVAESGDTAAPSATARPDENRAARLRNTARPARAPQADARPAAGQAAPADEAAERSDTPAADKDRAPMDPALAQWLAQLHLPPADVAVPKPAASGGVVSPDVDVSTAKAVGTDLGAPAAGNNGTAARPGERSAEATADAAAERAGRSGRSGRETQAIAPEAGPRAENESSSTAVSAEREPVAAPAPQGFALPAGFEPAQSAAALRAEAAAPAVDSPANVTVPAALDSPDFAQAFGVQVSVLARDGVHEARLHLNPAEMGPVSVQIAMDGERAHIDFGAQAAATRSAIEASLPELAAALRDAGLTLSGGGVSQHTPGRGDAERGSRDGAATTTRESASAATGTTSRPAWRGRASPGGVDLYA
jgi:flagellar hook-length control protein FliK